jgi:tRNA pseudouridine38-40 synthase
MPRYRLLLEYDGSGFAGWQFQPGCRTVQGDLENAVRILTKEEIRVSSAGRTDAGVHAAGQVASFCIHAEVEPERLVRALNGILPADVRVLSASEAVPAFDPRRGATGKTYRYSVLNRIAGSALQRGRVLHYPYRLDADAMRAAAMLFKGTHDFSAFRASDCEANNAVRQVIGCIVDYNGEGLITIDITATAFVKNMVRIITGTLIEVGNGRRTRESVANALSSGKREDAGVTAPPHGLTLVRVYYGVIPDIGIEWPAYLPAGTREGG